MEKNYKVSFRITKTWQYLKYLVFLRNISSSISLLFWNNAICLFFASEWFEIFAQCDSSYISSMSLIFERGRSKYNTVGNGMSKIDLTRRYASNIYVSVKNSLKKSLVTKSTIFLLTVKYLLWDSIRDISLKIWIILQ